MWLVGSIDRRRITWGIGGRVGGSGYGCGEGGGMGEGNGLGPGGMGSGSGSGLGFGVATHAIHVIIMFSMVSPEFSPPVELWHFLAMTCLAVSAEP